MPSGILYGRATHSENNANVHRAKFARQTGERIRLCSPQIFSMFTQYFVLNLGTFQLLRRFQSVRL